MFSNCNIILKLYYIKVIVSANTPRIFANNFLIFENKYREYYSSQYSSFLYFYMNIFANNSYMYFQQNLVITTLLYDNGLGKLNFFLVVLKEYRDQNLKSHLNA